MKKHLLFIILISGLTACNSQPAPVNTNQPSPVNANQPSNVAVKTNRVKTTSVQKDAAGDVKDGNGNKLPADIKGIDLTSVNLEIVEGYLQVTFESSGDIPRSLPNNETAIWEIRGWGANGNQGYQLAAKLIGTEWKSFIFDITRSKNTYIEKSPSISGNKLTVNFPLSNIPEFNESFTWSATAEYGGKWRDKVPDTGNVSF